MRRPSRFVTTASLALLSLASGCDESPVQPPVQASSSPTTQQGALAPVSRIDLGTLGGAVSYAMDINDAGIVVGWSDDAAGANRAFRWTSARGMVNLGTLPGDQWSRAISITSTGQVFGVSGRSGDDIGTPVVWTPSGNATSLPIPLLPGGESTQPANRNVLGQVTGTELGCCTYFTHAWVWSKSAGIYDIHPHIPGSFGESYGHDINAWGLTLGTFHARTCTGETHSPECWHVFLWNPLTRKARDIGIPSGDNLARTQVSSAALNDLGVVVGWIRFHGASLGQLQPYVWTDRTGFTVLPTFSSDAYAQSVNLVSTVVGASWDEQVGAYQAAAWPKAGGIVNLNGGNPNSSVAEAVNIFGGVVGWSVLDCCGFVTHATLWKLGPGRGMIPPSLTTLSQSPGIVAARVRSEAARSGPAGCLSDRQALRSKQLLVDCLVKRGK